MLERVIGGLVPPDWRFAWLAPGWTCGTVLVHFEPPSPLSIFPCLFMDSVSPEFQALWLPQGQGRAESSGPTEEGMDILQTVLNCVHHPGERSSPCLASGSHFLRGGGRGW